MLSLDADALDLLRVASDSDSDSSLDTPLRVGDAPPASTAIGTNRYGAGSICCTMSTHDPGWIALHEMPLPPGLVAEVHVRLESLLPDAPSSRRASSTWKVRITAPL